MNHTTSPVSPRAFATRAVHSSRTAPFALAGAAATRPDACSGPAQVLRGIARAMPTPARTRADGAQWSERWRRLRDAIVPRAERVLRAARRGRPVILGTAAEPWETLPDRRELLACLDGFRGLRLRFTSRSDRVLEDAEILAWLDRDHAVRVELRLDGGRLDRLGFDSPYVGRICRAIQGLAGRGLEARLVVEPEGDAPGRRLCDDLRRLAASLADAGAADLLLAEDAPAAWSRQIEPLRLAYGFVGLSGRVPTPGFG